MNEIESIEKQIKERGIKSNQFFNIEEYNVKTYNASAGNSKVGNCEKCKNKGKIAYLNEDGKFRLKICSCYNARKSREKLEYIGLLDIVKKFKSLENLPEDEEWQRVVKNTLIENTKTEYSLFIGGQVGSGKTTDAILVLYTLINKDLEAVVEFFSWDTEYKKIAFINEFSKESEKEKVKEIKETLKEADIVVIDDFLRHRDMKMTESERNFAKEIIDYRYRFNKRMIITSELSMKELIELDEAIGTRILEMCGKYYLSIKRDLKKNYRLKGLNEV